MFKSISLAAALLTALTVSANGAPVLTNGGFEQNPPSTTGNNIPHNISPWVLGGGSSANVVKVDGPGGSINYGQQAPESDASAPGDGIEQHYLDIADGANDFYQEFTPLCDGEVEYGAYFSRRTGGAHGEPGVAGIEIFRSSDNVSMAARQQTALMLGTPKTDPWTRVSYTTTLAAGIAYKFYVDMDNQMNIDNAFVNFGPSCSEHDDFDHDPEADPEPDFVFETTKTCGPIVQKADDTLEAICEITITYDTGMFVPLQISLDESVFLGSNLTSTAITNITSADDWDCGTLPVTSNSTAPSCIWNTSSTPPPASSGSTTLNVTLEFSPESGQSFDEARNCVNAHMYIGGGNFVDSGEEPICAPLEFEEKESTVETVKTCEKPVLSDDGSVSVDCQITLTYDSGDLAPDTVLLDEMFTVDGNASQSLITSISGDANWDCTAIPVANPTDSIGCFWRAISSTPPPSGQVTSVFEVSVEIPAGSDGNWQEAKNCAGASLHFDDGGTSVEADEYACVDINYSTDEITVETAKTCEQPTVSEDGTITADCQITVTYDSKGTTPVMVSLSEQMFVNTISSQTTIISVESNDAWECPALPLANNTDPLDCNWPGTSSTPPPVGVVTSVLNVVVQIPADATQDWQEVKNCVSAHFDTQPDLTTDSGELGCVIIPNPEDEPDVEPVQCTPFKHEVTCDTVNGGYQISLSNTLAGTFDPSSIDFNVTTAGVTAVSSTANPLLLTLQGATPGQTVQMSLSAIEHGAGSQPGLDLCCMGDVEVTIPDGLVCEPPRQAIMEINKSCEPFDGGDALGNTVCHLDVIYSGPAPTPSNPIVITDSSNSSTGVLSFNGQDPTTAGFDEWDCSANSFPTTGPAVCAMHNGIDTTATAGYWDSYFATLDLYITTTDEYKNCATASVKMVDGSVVDYEACHTQSDADLEISKRALFDVCHPGQIFQFEYTVSNVGTSPYNGNITLQDNITPIGGQITGINPGLCSMPSDLLGTGCTGSVSLTGSGSTTFVVDYRAPYDLGDLQDGELHAGRNCVTLQDETMGEFDDPTDIDGHQACTDFQIGKPLLEIEKVANGDGECLPGTECSYTINISTGDLPYDGRIALFENMGGLGGTITSVNTLPSACTISDPVQCVLPINLAANATYSITVTSTYDAWDQDTSYNRNCVGAYMVDNTVEVGDWSDETLTEDNVIGMVGHDCVDFEQTDETNTPSVISSTKTCEPITLGTLMVDGMLQDHRATIDCKITVTGENLQPGETVTLNDEFIQGGYSQAFNGFLDGTVTSTENWNCRDVNTGPTPSGDPISGSCGLSSDDLSAAGGSSDLHVVFQIDGASPIQGPLQNCISTGTTSVPIVEGQEPDICAPIEITHCADGEMVQDGQCVAPPTITASKTCEPATLDPVGYQANCTITVTSTGPLFTPYTIRDLLMGPNGQDSSKVTGITHTDNWHCGGQPPYAPGVSLPCEISPNNFPATLTSSINYTMAFSPEDAQGDWQNCMANNAEEPWGCVPIVFPEPDVVTPDPVAKPVLEPFKRSVEPCKVNKAAQTYSCDFEIGVRNVGGGAYSGPLVLDDSFGQPKPRNVKTTGGEGWECLKTAGLGTSCLNGNAELAPGASSSVTMSLTIPGLRAGGVFENCVGVGVGASEFQRTMMVQTIMPRLGIDGGPVDGASGRKTREGVKALQERVGLPQTGIIDDSLFIALGIPLTKDVQPECIRVDLPPMPRLPNSPVICEQGQQKNSKGVCYWPKRKVDCPKGQVQNSKGKCYKPQAPRQCDSRSTVKSGDGCACRYKGMRKRGATGCVCRNTGLGPVPGVGCPKIKVGRPKPDGPHGEGSSCRIKNNGICIK